MTTTTCKVDAKGRVSLGAAFANSLVLVSQLADGVVQVTLAEAVPAKEAWLHRNREAFKAVMRGLEQTGKGGFADSPDLEADSDIADKIKG